MTDATPGKTILSRQELYDRVWSVPIQELATAFGISYRGLAKICRQHKVPHPTPGYWARKAAGKRIVVPRLPEPKNNAPIIISPRQQHSFKLQISPEKESWLNQVRLAVKNLRVADELRRPHTVVAKMIAREGTGDDIDNRRHRILDALLKVLESHGGQIEEKDARIIILKAEGTEVEFRIERYEQPPTLLKGRPRAVTDQAELKSTSYLAVAIGRHLPLGLPSGWRDKENRPLEESLPAIVETLFVIAADRSERRRKLQAELEREEMARRIQHEQEKFAQEENEAWRRLIEIAREWRDAQRVLRFLDTIEARGFDVEKTIGERTLSQWMAWARDRAERVGTPEPDAESTFTKVQARQEKNAWRF